MSDPVDLLCLFEVMPRVPKYRKHSSRNKGFVEVSGKRIYFPGKFNSAEPLTAYSDFLKSIAKESSPRGPDIRATRGDDVPICLLVDRFLAWSETKFIKHGRSTGTFEKFRDNVTPPLLELFANLATSKFGPLDLKEVRQKFVESGLCRNEVNDRTMRIKRIFNWGVENELVPESTAGALKYVSKLQPGDTVARETEAVTSVEDAIVAATIPFLPPTVDDMVRLQQLTGCRPSEVRNLRWCDIDQSDDIWIYIPWEHKTEHKKKRRIIAIMSPAREIFEKYRHRPEDEFIFSPRETVRLINERRRVNRKTPVQPSQVLRGEAAKKRQPKQNTQYSRRAYNLAIERACEKAGVPSWSPNQLRHFFATETDELLDKEAARSLLGHSHSSTTEIYIDENIEKIKKIARQIEAKKRSEKKEAR